MAYLLHQLLHESAARAPERVAVILEDRQLRYGELAGRANQLARLLRRCGVTRGDRVGVCMSKGPEALIALHAVMQAGGAYVPIDPLSPRQRAWTIVEDAGIRLMLTAREQAKRLGEPPIEGFTMIEVDDGEPPAATETTRWLGAEAIEAEPAAPFEAEPLTELDLAYILYTSGSTGRPKGVAISHRASLAFVEWSVRALDICADDRLANHAPLHFDLSILDLFASMAVGATVVMVTHALSVFPQRLAAYVEDQRITCWYSVPSALIQLSLRGGLEPGMLSALRIVAFAGEVFPVRHLRALMDALPHPRYVNLYGPTETNVCTYYEVPGRPEVDAPPLPIGRACEGTEVLVVDEALCPVADGEEGELIVRGPTLSAGYWPLDGDQRGFIERSTAPGLGPQRFYRTGDRVLRSPSGLLTFLGRSDHMVKSRGYRIELGAVEATLLRHPEVCEAVVVPVSHDVFGCTLQAFVVVEDEAQDVRGLIAFCSSDLPRYMLPEIELVAELPRTSSGKVDRRRLRDFAARPR